MDHLTTLFASGWSRAAGCLLLASLWVGLAAPSCSNKNAAPTAAPHNATTLTTTTTATTGLEPADREPPPGSREVEDLGPRAPALLMLSSLKGYTEPCGCTADVLLGGIDRIAGWIEGYRALAPAAPLIHAGDLFYMDRELEPHRRPQEQAKAEVVAQAMRAAGLALDVPGPRDLVQGPAHYLELLARSGARPLAANLKLAGEPLEGATMLDAGGVRVGVVAAVDPALFEGVEGAAASAPEGPVHRQVEALEEQGAEAVVLAMSGDLAATKALLEAVPEIDFGLVGVGPRETDQVDDVGPQGHTLEPYDQGRYVGLLKFYEPSAPPSDEAGEASSWRNFLDASAAELQKIDRLIKHVHKNIARLPPAAPGEEPALLRKQRERLEELELQRERLAQATIAIDEGARGFVFRPIAMEPGYSVAAEVTALRQGFNRRLRELNQQVEREVVPAAAGQPFYVGNEMCASCHGEAHDFWSKTNHAHALTTLEERHKDFDQNCIGCHVVGYERPGGSVLGKLRYEGKAGAFTFTKDLRHVGCENCHGPGSDHIQAPVGEGGVPQHILPGAGAEVCGSCHVTEHSPKFDYDLYVRQITGPGHALGGSRQRR